ncbi:MAG: AraC family transcriptional regulator [bacterium]|nr:AraC family transcriptional regulator [bacterium]
MLFYYIDRVMKNYQGIFQSYIESISKLSGMEICIYDLNYFTYKINELYINWSFRSHNSPLCMLTKLSNERHKDCVRLEHNRLLDAFKSGGSLISEPCHSGLVDIVVPIAYGNRLIGGIFLGQVFIDDYPEPSIYERYFKSYNDVDIEDIFRVVKDIPIKSYSELLYWKDICRLLASYIEEKISLLELVKQRDGETYYISIIDDILPTLSEPIQKAVNIIKNRVTRGITLQQVASTVGYSLSQFSRRFKQETGMTFSQCLKMLKIELSQYLLKESGKSIYEIAFEVGYSDVPSFLRAFKDVTGMTPKEWIRHHVPIRAYRENTF